MATIKENVIDLLLKNNLLTREQLDEALLIQKEKGVPLRNVLISQKLISEDVLLSLFSRQLYIPTLHLSKYRFDPAVVNLVPERMSRLYNLIPLSKIGETLTVAMSDPLNVFALDDLKTITGCDIDTVLSSEEEISRVIDAQYRGEIRNMQDILEENTPEGKVEGEKNIELLRPDEIELSNALEEGEKAPIVKLVDLMLSQALTKRASDIHIEPEADYVRVRYRIDGSLHDILKIPKKNQNAVIARLKIVSNLDITENRIPQDGRFKVRFESKEVDFRVSSLPTTFGQKFVLRA
ncbi:MAG: ATPase, T2SS/T4P/T4SS family, partial [Candidatus Omnitrophota bacterium]